MNPPGIVTVKRCNGETLQLSQRGGVTIPVR